MQTQPDADIPQWALDLTSPLDEKMGFTLTSVSAERVTGSMPVEGNTQPFGLWHGGASGVLVETLASLGAAAAGMPGRVGVGVDLNVTHLRSATAGRVHGEATLLRRGHRTVCYQVVLTDDEGRTTAIGRLTCQLVRRPT